MKAILKKDVKNLGQKWDIVEVKQGYFLNSLFPQGEAIMPTEKLLITAQKHIDERAKKVAEMTAKAQEIKTELEGVTLKFKRKTTDSGKTLYAGLHKKDIAQALMEQAKLEIETKKIELKKDIKTLGEHKINIQLTDKITAQVKLLVEAE